MSSLTPEIQVSSNATVDPASGAAQDFSGGPVTYTVTAEDGTTVAYSVSVTAAAADAKSLNSFTVAGALANGVDESGKTAWAAVSFDTSLSSLTPSFTVTGSGVSNNGVLLVSGSGSVDFTSSQIFTVFAADGTTQDYTVSVTNAPARTECLISSFTISGVSGEISNAAGIINVSLPYGTDRSALSPVIAVSGGATVSPASGVARDFSSGSVTYTVTAEDVSYVKNYTVTVSLDDPSTNCQMLSFSLAGSAGVISGTNIAVTVPYGTDVSSLTPVYSVSPYATGSPATNSSQDFSSPVEYTVTAQDGTTVQKYLVTVTVASAEVWHTETFANATATGSTYADGTSDSNDMGVVWSFHGRTDSYAEIDSGNTALMIGKTGGYLEATLTNGCAKLKFRFIQGFSDTPAVNVLVNGSVVYTTAVSTSSVQETGEITVNGAGPCTLRLEAATAGDRVIVDDVSWTDGTPAETDAPTVSISSPASGAAISGSSITVSGTAADPGTDASGVASVWVRIDSGTWQQATGTTSWSCTLTGVSEGSHTIEVYSKDSVGNVSTTATVSCTSALPPDNTAPTVSISSPTSGQSITSASTTVTVSGTAADSGTDASGVSKVYVKLDSGSWQVASGTSNWSAAVSNVSDGSRTVYAYSEDAKGNCSTTNSVTFTFTYQASAYAYIVDGKFQPQASDPYYSYYSSAAGLSGDALRTALKSIISSGHSVTSYSGLWTAYGSSDRIPSGVNSGKIWDMYSDHGDGTGSSYYYTYSSGQCGSYSGEGSCYNREHSWPKSWFSEASPMYSDIVHVVPTDGYVNGRRSNYAFGIVGSATWTSENGSKLGSPSSQMTTWGCSESTVFEPIDAFKGDFARIYFYMCTRYWGTTESGPMTSSDFSLLSWAQTMLVSWHDSDAVSTKETDRNDAIQSTQGNRNPFVDYPGLVTIIDFTN